jgi:hypothetical protein
MNILMNILKSSIWIMFMVKMMNCMSLIGGGGWFFCWVLLRINLIKHRMYYLKYNNDNRI